MMWKASPLIPYPTSSATIFAPRVSRKFQFFENENSGAFAHDKTVAVLVKRTRCARRFIVSSRESAHRRKPANSHGRNRRFGAAADHDVGIAA